MHHLRDIDIYFCFISNFIYLFSVIPRPIFIPNTWIDQNSILLFEFKHKYLYYGMFSIISLKHDYLQNFTKCNKEILFINSCYKIPYYIKFLHPVYIPVIFVLYVAFINNPVSNILSFQTQPVCISAIVISSSTIKQFLKCTCIVVRCLPSLNTICLISQC